jgi:hypothetical protein
MPLLGYNLCFSVLSRGQSQCPTLKFLLQEVINKPISNTKTAFLVLGIPVSFPL